MLLRNPNSDSVPDWPPYETTWKRYIILDTPITQGENLKPGATDLLNKVINHGRPRSKHDELQCTSEGQGCTFIAEYTAHRPTSFLYDVILNKLHVYGQLISSYDC
jgi:hypothetical protein